MKNVVVQCVGIKCHEAFVDYILFMTECNRIYHWYCVAMYDYKRHAKLSCSYSIKDRFDFATVDMNLFLTILDSTAIRQGGQKI